MRISSAALQFFLAGCLASTGESFPYQRFAFVSNQPRSGHRTNNNNKKQSTSQESLVKLYEKKEESGIGGWFSKLFDDLVDYTSTPESRRAIMGTEDAGGEVEVKEHDEAATKDTTTSSSGESESLYFLTDEKGEAPPAPQVPHPPQEAPPVPDVLAEVPVEEEGEELPTVEDIAAMAKQIAGDAVQEMAEAIALGIADAEAEEDETADAPADAVDLSIPYDAAAKLAYEAAGSPGDYSAFKDKFEEDAVADVMAKNAPAPAVDLSVPYDAAAKLAYEAAGSEGDYATFKAKFEEDAVADVIAKQKKPEPVVTPTPEPPPEPVTPKSIADEEGWKKDFDIVGVPRFSEEQTEEVSQAARAVLGKVVSPLIGPEIERGVPQSTIATAALSTALFALITSQDVTTAFVTLLVAALISITPGPIGDVVRTIGELAGDVLYRSWNLSNKLGVTDAVTEKLARMEYGLKMEKLKRIEMEVTETLQQVEASLVDMPDIDAEEFQQDVQAVLKEADEAIAAAIRIQEDKIRLADAEKEELQLDSQAEEVDKKLAQLTQEANRLAEEAARMVAEAKDISIDYDAAAQLAYEKSPKNMNYESFKQKYEAEAVADVKTKIFKIKREKEQAERAAKEAQAAEEKATKEAQAAEEKAAKEAKAAEEKAAKEAKVFEDKRVAGEKLEEELRQVRAADEEKAAEKRKEEEARLADAERLLAEETRMVEEARLAEEAKLAETERLEKEARLAEDARLKEEEILAMEARLKEEAEDARLKEETARRKEEKARLEEEQASLLEAARLEQAAEEARLAEETILANGDLEEEARIAEEKRLSEEAMALVDPDADDDDVFSDEDWDASVEIAKENADGIIVDASDMDESEKADWDAAGKFARTLGSGGSAEEIPPLMEEDAAVEDFEAQMDTEELARAARAAVAKMEQNFAEKNNVSAEGVESDEFDEEDEDLFTLLDEEPSMDDLGAAARAAVEQFEDSSPNDVSDIGAAARAAVEAMNMNQDDDVDMFFDDEVEEESDATAGSVEPQFNWDSLKVADLRTELTSRGLPTTGKKAELVSKLEASDLERSRGETTSSESSTEDDDDDELDFDLEELANVDLEEIARAAREAAELFDGEEPSDEVLKLLENEELDFGLPSPDDVNGGGEDGGSSTADYSSMTVNELKDELRNRGLKVGGKKADLISRLQSSD